MKITGKVIGQGGETIVGAKVDIFINDNAIAGVTSADDAGFEFSNDTPCAGCVLKLVVTKEGFKPLTQTTTPVGDSTNLTLKLEELPHPINVAGVVRDQSGRPIAGARVGIFADDKELTTLTSDPQGAFIFSSENPPARRAVRLVVAKDGFKTLTQHLRPEGEKDLQLTLKGLNGVPWGRILAGVALVGGAVTIWIVIQNGSGAAGLPDLNIAGVDVQRAAGEIKFSVTIRNQGKQPIPAFTTIPIIGRFRGGGFPIPTNTIKGEISGGLGREESKRVVLKANIPNRPPMRFMVMFMVDPDNLIKESNEKNNEFSKRF